MARGRPSKYTPELQDQLCDQLRKGIPVTIACDFLGIAENTYYNWCESRPDFLRAVRQARAEAQIRCVGLLMQASTDKAVNFNPLAWYLERTNRQEFGREVKVEKSVSEAPNPEDIERAIEEEKRKS